MAEVSLAHGGASATRSEPRRALLERAHTPSLHCASAGGTCESRLDVGRSGSGSESWSWTTTRCFAQRSCDIWKARASPSSPRAIRAAALERLEQRPFDLVHHRPAHARHGRHRVRAARARDRPRGRVHRRDRLRQPRALDRGARRRRVLVHREELRAHGLPGAADREGARVPQPARRRIASCSVSSRAATASTTSSARARRCATRSRSCARSRTPTRPCSCSARAAPARSWSRARCTTTARARSARSSR